MGVSSELMLILCPKTDVTTVLHPQEIAVICWLLSELRSHVMCQQPIQPFYTPNSLLSRRCAICIFIRRRLLNILLSWIPQMVQHYCAKFCTINFLLRRMSAYDDAGTRNSQADSACYVQLPRRKSMRIWTTDCLRGCRLIDITTRFFLFLNVPLPFMVRLIRNEEYILW